MNPRIILYGLFGQQNLGNDCTLQAAIEAVRRHVPDASIECVCTGPADVASRHGIRAYPIAPTRGQTEGARGPQKYLRKLLLGIPRELRHWRHVWQTLGGVHTLLAPGTGLITDWGTTPFGRPYDLFKWCAIAKLRGCRIAFLSVGVGPIFHRISRWFFRSALRLAHYRSYRDDASRQYSIRTGVPAGADKVYPDLVFGLSADAFPSRSQSEGGRPIVGVGVMDYYGERGRDETAYADYLTKTAAFVAWLLDHDHSVKLLIGDALYDVTARDALREIVETRTGERGSGQLFAEEVHSIDQLLQQIAECDLVVSPRFHNLLMALVLGKPAISLSYNEKSTALMTVVDLGAYWQDIDTFDVEVLKWQFSDLIATTAAVRPGLEKKVRAFRQLVNEQYTHVFGQAVSNPHLIDVPDRARTVV